MLNFIKQSGTEKISLEDFIYFQNKYKITFSTGFKEFYLQNNGLKIFLCHISEKHEVNSFLQLRGKWSIESVKNDEISDGLIPDYMIPFAYDRGGDFYYYNSNDGKVYLIRGDNIEKYILIADNFDNFIDVMNNSNIVKPEISEQAKSHLVSK